MDLQPIPFTRDALAWHRKWLGISDSHRETLQAKYPSREAAIEAMEYGGYVAARDAIRVLGALGEYDLILHYALTERESSWIPLLAASMLPTPPIELLEVWVNRLKPIGGPSHFSDIVAYELPRRSYLHLGQTLVDMMDAQKRRWKPLCARHLTAIGYSALELLAPRLATYAGVDSLQTFAQALAQGKKRVDCRPFDLSDMTGTEHRQLDKASSCAIAAVCSLRRLQQPVDTERVRDWLNQLEQVLGDYRDAHEYWSNVKALRWVLFDCGDDSQFDRLLETNYGDGKNELGMSLLRRGDEKRFSRWRDDAFGRSPERLFPPPYVHFWPLIDKLQAQGFAYRGRQDDMFWMARATDAPAPYGWRWLAEPADK